MHNDPVSARYERSKKAVVVTFRNGAEMSLPVRLLEMITWDDKADGWVPISPSDEQLEAVAVGGDHLYWDEIGQDFLIPDLMAGIYGRPEWMRQLEERLAVA
ncbi:MAG: hypothetical protein AAGM45_17795 [Cyanobacteria bacterium J06588_5]